MRAGLVVEGPGEEEDREEETAWESGEKIPPHRLCLRGEMEVSVCEDHWQISLKQ